ncbi:hypothetical protein EV132_104321 [Rhizobium sullae]|uniref:Uncharacterized protein n=1 Tax=Rhizobium sullae TaxID=50338 RepID=A0A4V2V9H9_RHISU|nr:hypothetical protein EV132_104321 [Rhizobium sullae]
MRTGMEKREAIWREHGMSRVHVEINLAGGFCNQRLVFCSEMGIVTFKFRG